MGKCKTGVIQADLDIFRDIQTYSGIIGHKKDFKFAVTFAARGTGTVNLHITFPLHARAQ